MKKSDRYSNESLKKNNKDSKGRLFINEYGMTDLSHVEIVGSSVDTIRQLFYGKPIQAMLDKLNKFSEDRESIITLTDNVSSQKWHYSKMGKASGYRYKIQNNQEGIVILFGSYYAKTEYEGSHLKFELSPHFISENSVANIWSRLHGEFGLSRLFLETPEPQGVAIHLACDYQGFKLPDDFVFKFSTASRTYRAYDGINNIDLSDISEAVATYGGKQLSNNYLIGKAQSTQVALYDKSYEVIKSDKKDYFEREWGIYSTGIYDPEQTVRRFEIRFHHTIIREIGLGMEKNFESFIDVVPYLTDIWRYAVERNRLNCDDEHNLIHPMWQIFLEDVEFHVPAQGVRINRKKKESVTPIAHYLKMTVGNLLPQYVRRGWEFKKVMKNIKSQFFYDDLIQYYRQRNKNETDFREEIEKRLWNIRLAGNAA